MLDINYINELLRQGNTVKDIRSRLNISEKLFQRQIKKLGYKYNQKTKQYETVEYKDNIKVIPEAEYKDNINVLQKTKDLDINKVTELLVEEYDTIENMIKWFKDKENTIDRIVIDLPEAKDKRTTILINEQIYQQFNEFCDNHKEYSKKDLMAMALHEYINKYQQKKEYLNTRNGGLYTRNWVINCNKRGI